MPRAKSQRKFKPDEVVVAWEAFAADGIERVIQKGERLRGNDPAVKAAPWAFVPDGTPAGEMPNPWQELREREEAEQAQPDADVALLAEPEEYRDADVATLRRPLKVAVGTDGKGRPGRVVKFKAGARFLRDSELVRGFPDAFEKRT